MAALPRFKGDRPWDARKKRARSEVMEADKKGEGRKPKRRRKYLEALEEQKNEKSAVAVTFKRGKRRCQRGPPSEKKRGAEF